MIKGFLYYLTLVVLILLTAFHSIYSQSSNTSSKLGVAIDYNSNIFSADFKTFPGFNSSNPGFTSGTGGGISFGLFFTQPLSDVFDLSFRGSYLNLNAQLLTDEMQVVSIDGTPINAVFQHTLDAKISSMSFDILAGFKIVSDLKLAVGARLGLLSKKEMEMKESLVSSNTNAVYKENGTTTRNYYFGTIPNPNSMLLSLLAGLQYDINLGSMQISPEIFYDLGLSNISKDVSWKVSSLRFGLSFAYLFSGKKEESVREEKIYQEPIKKEDKPVIADNKSNNVTNKDEKNEEFFDAKSSPNSETSKNEVKSNNREGTDAENNSKSQPIAETKPIEKKQAPVQTQDEMKLASKTDNENQSGAFYRNSVTFLPQVNSSLSSYYSTALVSVALLPQLGRYDMNWVTINSAKTFQSLVGSTKFDYANPKNPKNNVILANNLTKSGIIGEIIASCADMDSIKARKLRSMKRAVSDAYSAANIESFDLEEMKMYINNTFLAIPVLSEIKKEGEKFTSIGAYYWFRLMLDEEIKWIQLDSTRYIPDISSVKLLSIKIDQVTFEGLPDKEDKKENKKPVSPDIKSVYNFIQGIQKSLVSMEEFKIRGVIQQIDNYNHIDFGKREGAYIDQGYKIYEQGLTKDNRRTSKYMGFVRLAEVADNTEKIDSMSKAYNIIPGSFDRGIIAVSHDQFLDINLHLSYRTITVPAWSVNWFSVGIFQDTTAKLLSQDASTSYNANLSFMYNTSQILSIPQLFVGLDVGLGFLGTSANTGLKLNDGSSVDFKINTPMMIEASLLIHKKFWFLPPLGGFAELQFGINSLKISGTLNQKDWELNYGLLNYGIGVNAGLNYALTPDINLGFEIGYRYVLPITEFKVVSTNGAETTYPKNLNEDFWKTFEIDKMQLGGIKFGLSVSYSLPPLF